MQFFINRKISRNFTDSKFKLVWIGRIPTDPNKFFFFMFSFLKYKKNQKNRLSLSNIFKSEKKSYFSKEFKLNKIKKNLIQVGKNFTNSDFFLTFISRT